MKSTMDLPHLDWSVRTGSAMVCLGTHRLSVTISGPPRTPQDPLVIILTGAGDVASSYTALSPLVCRFARILVYDRSGLGRSEPSPQRPSAISAAGELHSLLRAMELRAPLVLVAHSYGAIVAREYFHLHADEVVGMVLVDGSTERQCDYFQIPDPNINAVLGEMKLSQVTGLREDSALSREEWRIRAIDYSRGTLAAQAEADAFVEVCHALGSKRQVQTQAMGDKPLSVIRCNGARDYERIYQKGIEAGNGTLQQRLAFRGLLDRWDSIDQTLKEDQLQLSSNAHLVYQPDCGHNIHLVLPEVVAGEIQWILRQLQTRNARKL